MLSMMCLKLHAGRDFSILSPLFPWHTVSTQDLTDRCTLQVHEHVQEKRNGYNKRDFVHYDGAMPAAREQSPQPSASGVE